MVKKILFIVIIVIVYIFKYCIIKSVREKTNFYHTYYSLDRLNFFYKIERNIEIAFKTTWELMMTYFASNLRNYVEYTVRLCPGINLDILELTRKSWIS